MLQKKKHQPAPSPAREQPFFRAAQIFPKLSINEPGDQFEKEADAVADQVMRLSASPSDEEEKLVYRKSSPAITLQRKCSGCEKEIELQMKPDIQSQEDNSGYAPDELSAMLHSSAGSGSPIPESIQEDIGGKMGAEFSNVRIHTGSSAIHMNESLGAHAFTHGTDIYFNKGKYAPHSKEGLKLLAHELTHVVQQTGEVQTFQAPDIQKFDPHEKIEEQLRAKNPELITEAPIPGGETIGKGFTKMGYADLFKSTGSIIPGIFGAKYAEEEDPATKQIVKKYAYKNTTNGNSLKKPEGQFTRNPQLVKEPVSVFYENGVVKYYVKKNEVTASTRGSLITGAFPQDFFVGDIKKGDDNLTLATVQLNNYRKGLQEFSQYAHRDFGIAATNEGQLYKDIVIPDGLDYSKFSAQNGSLGDGHLTHASGQYTRRYWLYPYREKGLYLYIWLPHPWASHVPKYQQAGKDVMDELDKVNKGLKVTQKKPGRRLDMKRKESSANGSPQPGATVKHKTRKKSVQRDTDWGARKKSYLESRQKWIDNYAKKYLKRKEIDDIVEEKVAFDKKIGIPTIAHGAFAEVSKQFKQIEFWEGSKGRTVAELRFLLGDKFDKLADKFKEIQERTKKTRSKADSLSGSRIAFGWKKKVIQLLMQGFKIGFKAFIAETYSIFAGCIGGMIQKFEEGFTNMEEVEALLAQLEAMEKQVENLLQEITAQYEAQMQVFESILDQMEDIKFYAEILSNAETLIRVGVQVISCVSPPALGCLWGLVAQVGIEVGLDLVVGTEWFEKNFMRPLVKDLIDKFLKDDILAFMNKLFTKAGLADYMKDVEACKVSVAASSGSGTGWYAGTYTIPSSQYKQHSNAWESKYKDQILNDIAASFNGGTTGKTVSKADIEKLIKMAQEKNMSADDFITVVQGAKQGENKYDFNAVQGAVQSAGAAGGKEEGGGNGVPVIDARKQATDNERRGTKAENATIQIQALSSHTKGATPELTIWLFENGEHIATIVNVPSKVIKRTWWPSENEKKKLKISYLIPKQIPLIKTYFIAKGSTITGYAEP